MVRTTYHFVPRPSNVPHQHPYLVFDGQDRLHFHLTIFAKEADAQLSTSTARVYLYALLPFFTFLDTDIWQQRTGRRWDSSPENVRQAIDDYLVQHLCCKVRAHDLGFQVLSITQGTRSTIRTFLAGLKLFYRVMRQRGYYPFMNPLVDPLSALYVTIDEQTEDDVFPRMPDSSGIAPPRHRQRLSDSYFKLEGETWVPHVVDDTTLPKQVLDGGRQVGWGLREECVVRILFESGGRVSEVVGLTLGDWMVRGMLQEANAFSKGSHGKRVKFLRFSNDTAKLLRRYVDEDRRRYDPQHYQLEDYVQLAQLHHIDVQTIPLFLSTRGTPLSTKTFREHFWNPACAAVHLEMDIHQARHWYVTMAVRQIYETSTTDAEIKRRLRELIEYVKWKQGWQTIEAYEHYFDASRHAEIQNAVHQKMDETLKHQLKIRSTGKSPLGPERVTVGSSSASIASVIPNDPDFDFLRSIGGSNGN